MRILRHLAVRFRRRRHSTLLTRYREHLTQRFCRRRRPEDEVATKVLDGSSSFPRFFSSRVFQR